MLTLTERSNPPGLTVSVPLSGPSVVNLLVFAVGIASFAGLMRLGRPEAAFIVGPIVVIMAFLIPRPSDKKFETFDFQTQRQLILRDGEQIGRFADVACVALDFHRDSESNTTTVWLTLQFDNGKAVVLDDAPEAESDLLVAYAEIVAGCVGTTVVHFQERALPKGDHPARIQSAARRRRRIRQRRLASVATVLLAGGAVWWATSARTASIRSALTCAAVRAGGPVLPGTFRVRAGRDSIVEVSAEDVAEMVTYDGRALRLFACDVVIAEGVRVAGPGARFALVDRAGSPLGFLVETTRGEVRAGPYGLEFPETEVSLYDSDGKLIATSGYLRWRHYLEFWYADSTGRTVANVTTAPISREGAIAWDCRIEQPAHLSPQLLALAVAYQAVAQSQRRPPPDYR